MSITDYSRTMVTLVKITFPWCGNTFGVSPCASVGSPLGVPCFNTYHTCSDQAHFTWTTKTYSFSSADAPPPFPGPRPYVKNITYLATEIFENLTKTGRIKVEFANEPDMDIGIDPYVTRRALWPETPGTFFKKLIARNPNYKGQVLEIFEGVLGDPEASFVKKAHILLETGAISTGSFTFESLDLLAGLNDVECPKKVDIKLLTDISTSSATITLTDTVDADNFDTANQYIRIDDEIIGFSGYDPDTHVLSGLTRAAFGSVNVEHSAGTAVQPCRYFAPGNPFDHLLDMLFVDAAYDVSLVDFASFGMARDWPELDIPMSAIFSEPTKLNDIYMGLVNQLNCRSWVAENLQITIRRNIANQPGRQYVALSDADAIIKGSCSIDLWETSRKTRCAIFWEKTPLGKFDDLTSYQRIDVGVNADAETEYGDTVQETLVSSWLTAAGIQDETLAYYMSDLLQRRMFYTRDASPILTASVDPKNGAMQVGDYVTLTTDEFCNPDGTPVRARFQIIKRDYKGAKVEYRFQRMPVRRNLFYTPEEVTSYETATEAQREYGGFYCDDNNRNSDGSDGFLYY